MRIWKQAMTLNTLNSLGEGNAISHMGIIFTAIGDDWLEATMPIDHRTLQPFGVLHGGASVLLAETIGSCASLFCINSHTHHAVGLDINANHIRPATKGVVTAKLRPLHLGRSTHVWQIHIHNEEQKLVCVSRLTMSILEKAKLG